MGTNQIAITLIDFSDDQLLFDEEETRAILIFFFPAKEKLIRELEITNRHRNFAQGLMVAAVDASYLVGWIELIARGYYKPAGSIKGALKKLARQGAKHWFKHATREKLIDAKIAESVRVKISDNFGSVLEDMRLANTTPFLHTIYINLAACRANGQVFWG